MIDEETGEPVDTAHKGRGYEISKGKYVPIDDDELQMRAFWSSWNKHVFQAAI